MVDTLGYIESLRNIRLRQGRFTVTGHRVVRIREIEFDHAWSRVAAARGHALAGVVYSVKGDAWGTVRVVPEGGDPETIRYPEGTTLIVDGAMVHLPAGQAGSST